MWNADKLKKRQELGEESESDEDEDAEFKSKLDEERLSQIKGILFDIHRVCTGEDKLYIPEFIDALLEASNIAFDV